MEGKSSSRLNAFILEPVGSAHSATALAERLRTHASEVAGLVQAHGALLIRGYDVSDARAFADAMGELAPALRPMGEYFLAEDGRVRVDDARLCRETNTFKRTGGYMRAEVVPHTENFYSTDVPEVLAFFCQTAPRTGGETGIFCAVRALALLPHALRAKLESECFDAQVFRTHTELASACGLPADASLGELAKLACARGVASCEPVPSMPSMLELRIRKPVVLVGKGARRSRGALNLNSAELGEVGLRALTQELEGRVYARRPGWWLHRLLWRCARHLPLVATALGFVDNLAHMLRAPLAQLRFAQRSRLRASAAARAGGVRADGSGRTLRAALRLHEAEDIGRALGQSCALFSWRAGDILLLDNLTVLHDGMPGRPWEARKIFAMLFNPIPELKHVETRSGQVGSARTKRWPGKLHINDRR